LLDIANLFKKKKKMFPKIEEIYPDLNTSNIDKFFSENNELKNINHQKIEKIFFIGFTNRSGSNFFAQTLSTTQQLLQAGENLNFDTVINISKQKQFTSYTQYLNWLINDQKSKMNIFGCKISVGQLIHLYNIGFLPLIKEKTVFFHIHREDILDQAISFYIANITQQWTSEQKTIASKINYDGQAIFNIMKSIEYQNATFRLFFKSIGIDPIVLEYNELIQNTSAIVQQAGKLLGLNALEFDKKKLRYEKQSDEINERLKTMFLKEYKL
jgi:trehalose 2-sulfotransferase